MNKAQYYLASPVDKRKKRVRSKIHGTATRPRVSVNRSNQHIYVQVINDETGVTLFSVSDAQKNDAKDKQKETSVTKTQRSVKVGEIIAKKLLESKIKAVVFDRGAYRYHGRIKAVAESLRAQGVQV